MEAALYKNGVPTREIISSLPVFSAPFQQSVSLESLIQFNGSTDYVQLYAYNQATSPVINGPGTPLPGATVAAFTQFWGYRVGLPIQARQVL
jgi:hypothetical protein